MSRQAIPAGLFDAGFSSLATFIVGLYAVRSFRPDVLGAYALAFGAYVVATPIAKQLLFVPSEVVAVGRPPGQRLNELGRSLRFGVPVAAVGALLVPAWLLVAPGDLARDVLLGLTVSLMAVTFTAPIQEHVRQMLHIDDANWSAALVSASQLACVMGALVMFSRLHVPGPWIPFMALAVSQVVSMLVGLALAGRRAAGEPDSSVTLAALIESGRWLLAVGLLPVSAGFVAAILVAHLAGAEALGFAEGARVVSQPIYVLTAGLAAVLGPRSIDAAQRRDRRHARRVSATFLGLVTASSLLYALAVGLHWRWNPLPMLLPNAYAVGGLVLLMIVANALMGVIMPYRYELLGARRERSLTAVEAAGSVGQIAGGASAPWTGSFAIPLGLLAGMVIRLAGLGQARRGIYPAVSLAAHPPSPSSLELPVVRAPAGPLGSVPGGPVPGGPVPGGRRLRVLISAFWCQPGSGSEPGVGWNVAREMARYHEVWVMTQRANRPAIEAELARSPTERLHFEYFDLPWWPARLRVDGTGVRFGLQWYYYCWQLAAVAPARRLTARVGFDLAHHVTNVKYWHPSVLGFVGVPFIWGPVGGGDSAPRPFWRDFRARDKAYELLRNAARWLGDHDPFVRATARASRVALVTTSGTAGRLRSLDVSDIRLFSDIGMNDDDLAALERDSRARSDDGTVRFISIGNLIHWKGFHLGLEAFARMALENAEFWVVGDGPQQKRLESLCARTGITERVRFWGRLPRRETLEKLGQSDVMVFPSLHDSGGWVAVEGMAAGKPIICLDWAGPAFTVTDETGIRVPATTPEQTIEQLARAMRTLALDPELRRRMAAAARVHVRQTFSWRERGKALDALYREAGARASQPAEPTRIGTVS